MMVWKSWEPAFWAKVDFITGSGCWLWRGAMTKAGYGQLRANGKTSLAHRLSWAIEYNRGVLPPKHKCVMHKCDNPACVNPAHLSLGTHSDNMQDMWDKGRNRGNGLRGETAGNSKLKEHEVLEIRRRFDAGEKRSSIAEDFGVTKTTVSHIAKRKTWTHI